MVRNFYLIVGQAAGAWLLAGACMVVHAQTDVGIEAGLRTDYLRFNIAGPGDSPNILSELTWENVKSQYVNVHAAFKSGDFNLRGDYGYGRITQGDNQDSDYLGNNRTEEFSRSNNKANGDDVNDAKLGAGIEFEGLKQTRFKITPWVGLSRHQQNLNITQGFQTIPASGPNSGPIPNLNSTYKAQWTGPWAGLNLRFQADANIAIHANFEHHWANYSAKGNWNLRECWEHPESYTHNADGMGNDISLSADIDLNPNVTVSLSMTYSSWITDAGTNAVHLTADFYTRRDAQGNLVCIPVVVPPQEQIFDPSVRLNEVKWQSRNYLVGINMRL